MPVRTGVTLLESTRHVLVHDAIHIALGMAAQVAFVVGSNAFAEWLPSRSLLAPQRVPYFLAPRDQRPVQARQETLHYIGLSAAPGLPVSGDRSNSRKTVEAVTDKATEALALVSPDQDSSEPQRALSEIEVDSLAETDPSSEGPTYPPALLADAVEGVVRAMFVVDTTGRADQSTFKVLESSDTLFTDAVRQALPRMKYRPAWLRGHLVPQLVEQQFAFRITKPATAQHHDDP